MYELTIKAHFDAAHRLRQYQGKCANIHGHTWQVEVAISGKKLDDTGMLIDFGILKGYLNEIVNQLDHKYLNELDAFSDSGLNPTAENIARHIYESLTERLNICNPSINLEAVTIWESPNASAKYRR